MMRYYLFLIFIMLSGLLRSQPLITFDTVVTGLHSPVDAEEVNDSSHRIFIVEQTGKIQISNGTTISSTPFLDVASLITTTGPEQGLLSLAFHPDYSTNGYFFIYYTNKAGEVTIARYKRNTADLADASSGVVLMTIPKPFQNHNGGNLVFGPDGYLYFGTGDGGSRGDPNNNAQNNSSLLGKMLRIDINKSDSPYYSIPATNPFKDSITARPEIIAKGLRNPWRWSFDKTTGDMWIADVGQDAWEEVNVVIRDSTLNKNYGWKCFEATHPYEGGCDVQANNVFPIFEYPHDNATGGYSITGGFVYRGSEYPALQGYYICTDYISRNGWLIKANESGGYSTTMQQNWPAGITSFVETANGTLYAITMGGALCKVVAGIALPLHLTSFTGREAGNKYEISWQIENEERGDIYILEKSSDLSQHFAEVNRQTGAGNTSSTYFVKVPLSAGQSFYRLKIVSVTGQVIYSRIISSNGINRELLRAFITGTTLLLKLPAGTTTVEIFDAEGKSVKKQDTDPTASQVNIPLNSVAKGILTIRSFGNNDSQVARVLF